MTIKGQINGELENIIERMKVGDEGFTLPWALSFVPNGDKYDAFLNVKYPVFPKKQGTAKLYIKRTGTENNDFEVNLDSVKDYQWSDGEAEYVGCNEEDMVNIGEVDIL